MNCHRCARYLKEGELKYIVSVSVTADFDGVLKEEKENIDDILKEIEYMDEYALERDVYENLAVILCKRCKDHIIDELRGKYIV
jgi:hypothetical protein